MLAKNENSNIKHLAPVGHERSVLNQAIDAARHSLDHGGVTPGYAEELKGWPAG